MLGFKESREALLELPEDWRKRAVEMARGRQMCRAHQFRKACIFAAVLIVALLLLVGIVKVLGLPIVLVQVGVIVLALLGSLWTLVSSFRESARVQIEVVKELQQSLGGTPKIAPNTADSQNASRLTIQHNDGRTSDEQKQSG